MKIDNKLTWFFAFAILLGCSSMSMGQGMPAPTPDRLNNIDQQLEQRRIAIQELTLKILRKQSEGQKKIDTQNTIKDLTQKVMENQKKIEELQQEAIKKKMLEDHLKQLQESIPVKLATTQEPLQKKISELSGQQVEAKKTIDQVRQDTKNKIEEISLKQKEVNELKKKLEQVNDQLMLTKRSEAQLQAELTVTQKKLAKKEQQQIQTQKLLDQEGAYREQMRQDMMKEKQALEEKCIKLEQELKQVKEPKKSK